MRRGAERSDARLDRAAENLNQKEVPLGSGPQCKTLARNRPFNDGHVLKCGGASPR
jgi:hypothetical protein